MMENSTQDIELANTTASPSDDVDLLPVVNPDFIAYLQHI